MIQKTMKIPTTFAFLLQIITLVQNKKRIPMREIKMLSCRFSGKTHNTLYIFFILLLIQTKSKVQLEFIRSRTNDTLHELNKMISKVREYQPNAIIKSNSKLGMLEVNGNIMKFTTLNEEKNNIKKGGGKIGATIADQMEYIFVFFEECSQLDFDLVENYRHSVRGNSLTEIVFFYASNPWVRTHWFIQDFIKILPENKKYEKELYEKGYNSRYIEETETVYYRPHWTRNAHNIKPSQIREIEALKEVNYNKWKIVSLGFSGSLNPSLYRAALNKADTKIQTHLDHEYFGGVDWGDGKSKGSSPTTALIMGISYDNGIDIYGELEWYNNKGLELTTEEILCKFADFYIEFYKSLNFKKTITIFIDSAALGDFYLMFQQVIDRKGYGDFIFVEPAFKPKNTWERVETVNALLSMGVLRLNTDVCPRLWEYLENCYEVPSDRPTEDKKRERSHEFTHGIHALEYGIGSWFKEFQDKIPVFDRQKNSFVW